MTDGTCAFERCAFASNTVSYYTGDASGVVDISGGTVSFVGTTFSSNHGSNNSLGAASRRGKRRGCDVCEGWQVELHRLFVLLE
jgi:hypothetical protein